MSELHARQFRLYEYLKERGDQYTTQQQIADDLKWFYYYDKNENFHDSSGRHLLTLDIRALNESNVIQKIIISNSKGVKIATADEFAKQIKSEYASVFRRLKRIRQKEAKGNRDGQMRLVFKHEREVIEAFLNEETEAREVNENGN